MNRSQNPSIPLGHATMHGAGMPDTSAISPQFALLDTLFPGFSALSTALQRYSGVDISIYVPVILTLGVLIWSSRYISQWFWDFMDQYLMSTADIRIDDEMYNMVMAWVAQQGFAKTSRRFVANTNLNSRMWWLFQESREDEDLDGEEDDNGGHFMPSSLKSKNKKLQFTPSFGSHYFWYKGRPFIFSRTQDRNQNSWGTVSERESISLSSFGRDTSLLKDLLDDCRSSFQKLDEKKTIIYRGGLKKGTAEPTWTRCSARASRPFSTVVLDESVKQGLLDDMTDYLHPYTRRWYSNRGIPYRRGYLLYGPPGTGKSSLSFAIAGYFKLKIYIVSLNSPAMNEENLGNLFAELPNKCLVLLEDIDTAGLTHTRDDTENEDAKPIEIIPGSGSTLVTTNSDKNKNNNGRISLSALLNILDGVASQEGRVLVMTTNHIEKLDEALIRPGRVDMKIKFDLASTDMMMTIFRAIFATIEGDIPPSARPDQVAVVAPKKLPGETQRTREEEEKLKEKERQETEAKALAEEARISELGKRFAEQIPAMTFSPAEIQGFLLKNKREPEMAVKNAAEWVTTTLAAKKKKAKEDKENEAKEKIEKEKAEKEKAEKEKAEKEKPAEEKQSKEAESEKKPDNEVDNKARSS